MISERRHEILNVVARHGGGNTDLFGSAARGEDTQDSDIDLLVDVIGSTSPWFPGSLAADLEQLLGKRVQVVVIRRSLSPLIREAVLRKSVPLRITAERVTADSNSGSDRVFASRTLQDAILRNLQALCESVTKVDSAYKTRYPELTWRRIAGMRNVLVHDYFDVDSDGQSGNAVDPRAD